MSTEKIIKCQAKKSLKGNWIIVIAAVVFVCVVLILAQNLIYMFGLLFRLIDKNSGIVLRTKELQYFVLEASVFTALFFASPVINGIYRIVYNIAKTDSAVINDMFFFFKNARRYFRTLLLNLLIGVVAVFFGYGFDPYFFATKILKADLQNNAGFNIITFVLVAALIASVIIKILIYLIFIHFQMFAYAANDSLPLMKYILGVLKFSFRHLGATLKLLLSFTGWIALCFFVVPAFYTAPYFAVSMAVSAKWLFSLDKDRGLLC